MVVQELLLNYPLVNTKKVKVVIDFYVILKFQSIILKYQIDTLDEPLRLDECSDKNLWYNEMANLV
jgi:hypothetical protein